MENKIEKEEIFVCDCHSLEHQFAFWYDEEDNQLFLMVHLTSYQKWWQRIWPAIKYVFGYKSRYGEFDSTILKFSDKERLIQYVNKLKSEEDFIKEANKK